MGREMNRDKMDSMDKIRVSIGTADLIGLYKRNLDIKMETAYLLMYHNSRCTSNCKFCAQASGAKSSLDRIARGVYPQFPLKDVVERLAWAVGEGRVKRACIQTLNYPGMFADLLGLVRKITDAVEMPVSISRHPMNLQELEKLQEAGVDRVVIPLDAATPRVFREIKGSGVGNRYTFEGHLEGLRLALEVYGRGRVGTHLIIGIGESEEDALRCITRLLGLGIDIGLFAHVPIPGTPLARVKRPDISSFRRVQLGMYLLKKGHGFDRFVFNNGVLTDFGISGEELDEIVELGEPFMTGGCPNCNRPFSTESPGGPFYNYPEKPTGTELLRIKNELGIVEHSKP